MSKVSVLIPTYNRQHYLVEAIHSVETQRYGDWELVVVDDGSTDNTRDTLARLSTSLTYIHQSNRGVAAARNHAFRTSSGEYVLFLDSDDTLLPNSLNVLAAALQANPHVDVVFSDGYVVDGAGVRLAALADYRRAPMEDSLEYFILGSPVVGLHSAMFRREALVALEGPFDEQMIGYEDWDLFVRLKAQGCRFLHVPEPTCCYRFHGGNKSAPKSGISQQRRESLIRKRQKEIAAPWFDSLSLRARHAFFQEFLTGALQGDRARQAQVTAHRSFLNLPAKTRSELLYHLTVANILSQGASRQDRQVLAVAIKLDPMNLKPYPLLALTVAGNGLPEKALSRWRRARAGAEPPDPVTRILRAKKVA
jgi:glycosyltransferase involved in cell wall biosynthesis